MVEKTIRLNPEFMSVSGNVKKSNPKKVKPQVPSSKNKTKNMRDKFLNRIKEHHNNTSKRNKDKKNALANIEDKSGDQFLESLKYLDQVASKNRKDKVKGNKPQHLKKEEGKESKGGGVIKDIKTESLVKLGGNNVNDTTIPTNVNDTANVASATNVANVADVASATNVANTTNVASATNVANVVNIPNINNIVGGALSSQNNNVVVPIDFKGESNYNGGVSMDLPEEFGGVGGKEPKYGNLKGGKKPTYRTLKNGLSYKQSNNKTITSAGNEKNRVTIEIFDKDDEKDEYLERAEKMKDLKHEMAKKKTSITKIKHRLGKQNKTGKIGVLIKDRSTRKRIKNDLGKLKQTRILEIKNYLKKQNLLKGGTDAPPDVLRELYENAMLTGEVLNNNKDTLMHNYLET